MSYRVYKPEPMSSEMVRVMQDWYDGRNSMFFKVSIGESEKKRIRPSVDKHFSALSREARTALVEMTDTIADKHPKDVKALQDIVSWAVRQKNIIKAREKVRETLRDLLDAGLSAEETASYIQQVLAEWANT